MNQFNAATTRERARKYIRDGLLDTGLDSQHLAVAIYRRLAAGAPVTKADLAATPGLAPARIEPMLAAYPPSVIDYDAEGAIVAFAGLDLKETAHEFRTAGVKLYTWCVLDAARLTNEVQFLYDQELQWEQNTITSI